MKSWAKVTFESVTAGGTEGLRRGPFGGAIKKEIFARDGYKIYEQKHAIYGDFDAGEYFIEEHHYRKLKSFAVQSGDMLVSCSGTLGRVAIVPPTAKPGIINQALLRIRPKLDIVSPVFFKMLLETPELQSSLFGSGGGSAIKNVRPLSAIRKVEFRLPPLAEQRRIAEVLDRAEALRTRRRAALAQLDSLTQSLFLDIFGDPATNPKRFQVLQFSDACERIFKGAFDLKASSYREHGIPFIRIADIQGNTIDLAHAVYVDEGTYLKYRGSELLSGDLVFSKVGTIDRIAVIPRTIPHCVISQNNVGAKLRQSVAHSLYALTLLTTPFALGKIRRGSKKAVQDKLVLEELRKLPFMLPPLELQREFARRVTAVDALKTTQRASLAELDALFGTLQYRAFRGELAS